MFMFHTTINLKMMIAKLLRNGRIRQLHTIISQETIKPSSPTLPHLKTHNLTILDQFAAHVHMPIIFFYPRYNNRYTEILKKSLSQCLTQYYPLAGRFLEPSASHIECNDEGVDFLEACHDTRLNDFIHKKEQDESLDQFIPRGLGCDVQITSPNLVEVQLNHFVCGGAAVAVSISHKVADGLTMLNFLNHWATVTCGGTPINPVFVSSSTRNPKMPGFMINDTKKLNYTRRRFIFPNSKLNELKNKVNAMGTTPINPTRVELLTSLLFKCGVNAAKINSGSMKSSNLFQSVDMRSKIIKNSPEMAAGNISTTVVAKMAGCGEIKLDKVIDKLREGKKEIEGLRDVQEVAGNLMGRFSMLVGDQSQAYTSFSMCRFPFYELDFGWGKPVDVVPRIPDVNDNCFLLMDTPSRDGIEALVRLQEEEMIIFQKDEELAASCIC